MAINKLIFSTWSFEGKLFLAIINNMDIHVVDQQGGYYGHWEDIDEFLRWQKAKIKRAITPISQCYLQVNQKPIA